MLSPKLVNMSLVMKKFVKASNMFLSNLPMQFYKKSSLGQIVFDEGQYEWNKAYIGSSLRIKELNVLMKIKSISF
jgi:hypothetical protein